MSQGTQSSAGAVFSGDHMAMNMHMAMGFLMYSAGGRTFGSSKPAVAAWSSPCSLASLRAPPTTAATCRWALYCRLSFCCL